MYAPSFERPPGTRPGPSSILRDAGGAYLANGLIGLIFAASGPVAVILAAGAAGDLTTAQLTSWIFGVFVLNGILTVVASWIYRMPLGFAWTIPGTVLVGAAVQHLTWAEVVGAFLLTGLLIILVGMTGLVRQAMSLIPMPIVMGMVAGVFLQFGLDIVGAVGADPRVAVPIVVAFFALHCHRTVSRRVPPIIGAFVVGAIAVVATGSFHVDAAASTIVAVPVFTTPEFTVRAAMELVVPLAITVIVVQNGQGVAVLREAGHHPPVNVIALASGVWSALAASVGAISSCLTGPTNALLVSGGRRDRQYIAALTFGLLAIVIGVFAPVFVMLMQAMPSAFIATVGGLALLGALQGAFRGAFSSRFTTGALVTFLVTVSDLTVLNIGSAFWGLVAGTAVSWVVERDDLRATDPIERVSSA
ncbi:benzoate/H(+) symporter BenE family transporter [Gordonia amicalis]|uniref:Benzoate/H(+) symporter BenE family transporter n=1 Tax=Gordonia amicalis TaxID=89053 RepID=A0AAE4U484_9ACTN|nr:MULTISPECIES: benzoate/H(+) symporter BenE family transporter [Gordonia]MCZ4578210.1 benzoate/H(+) symporter BenE family transporter [Gordonia amicalis]MCZ4652790.1 benzoate/H(+) symporter BenE family transporter [Gordonia amicalis]MDV6311010.1 benzoate/H(+) symporter BenE family transporter [Gordonia amicalis]UPW13797.1 benzoate/H(+) symporter BenE family transporter [Gordonia amicalis]